MPLTIDERLAQGELIEQILDGPGFARRQQAATKQALRADLEALRTQVMIADPSVTAAVADQRVRDIISKNALIAAEANAAEAKAAWDAENSPAALWRKANSPEALAAKAAQDARVRAAVVERQRRDLAKAPDLVDLSMPDVTGGYGGKDRR